MCEVPDLNSMVFEIQGLKLNKKKKQKKDWNISHVCDVNFNTLGTHVCCP